MPTTLPARSATRDRMPASTFFPLITIAVATVVLLILFPSFRDATAWQDEYQMPLIGP